MRLRTVLVPAAIAAVGLAVTTAPAVVSASSATTHVALVRPTPAVVGHQLGRTLAFPPATQYCRDNIGIQLLLGPAVPHGLQPEPLYKEGDHGQGPHHRHRRRFGSPTALADLKVFDETYGLPDPPSSR